jgi:tyrosyl-tRNA synthetase
MTTDRTITLTPELQQLKAACRALVRAFGGQVAAADRLSTRQQRISDCCSANTDSFLRVDEIATLEAETVGYPGHPHVTNVLARQRGRETVETPAATATGRDLLKLYAHHSKENSDLAQTLLDANADGDIELIEAEAIDDAIDDVISCALAMRAEVRMIIREGRQ